MKVLVVRFSSIGDVVLTTPVIRCIKQQVPNVELHVATKAGMRSLLEGNPYIDCIHAMQKKVDELIPALKQENFDLVIDLHNNIRTLKLKRKLGVKSFAFPKLNISKWLLTQFKWNRMPEIHVVDRYFKAVEALGVKNDKLPCDFFLSPNDQVDLKSYDLSPKGFVAVAMGAQYATKQLPIQLLVNSLKGINIPIVLLGGKEDVDRATQLLKQLSGQVLVDFTGQLTLKQSGFLCKEAKVLLTGDTGLMHIASAFETPTVSVWGNTVPALGMYVYAPKNPENYSIHEVPDLSCRPCSKIGYQSCPKKHFRCMNDQDPVRIQLDIQQRLQD